MADILSRGDELSQGAHLITVKHPLGAHTTSLELVGKFAGSILNHIFSES